MKKQKQMLSASINDDEEEDIFPDSQPEIHSIEQETIKFQAELITKKREREEPIQEVKIKKSKFEPLPPDNKQVHPNINNNIINPNVFINPNIKALNIPQQPNYNYYNSNLHTSIKAPYNNYNYYQNPSQYGANNSSSKL